MTVHTASIIAKNRRILKPVLKEHGLNGRVLASLAARGNPQKKIDRLKILVDEGIPLTGVVTKLKLSETDFERLVLRHRGKGGLNEAQQTLFDFMRAKKVPKRVAMDIARRKTYHQMQIHEKFEYFESIELDPKVYGVRRIPVKYFVHLLTKPLGEIRRGIKRQVLWKMEDDFAAKKLDEVLPNWRNMRTFYRVKDGKRIPLRSSRIRRQILQLSQEKIPLRARHIRASLERAEKEASELRRSNGRRKVLEGSELDTREKSREISARQSQIRKLEKQIAKVSKELEDLDASSATSTATKAVNRDRRSAILHRRNRLMQQRDGLLIRT